MEAQEKRKEYHDKMIKKNHEFEIGEKVLYYNAAKENNRQENLKKNGKDHITYIK